MSLRWMKVLVALSAYGVLAAPVPSSDIGSCTVTELEPADAHQFCCDRLLILGELAHVCGLPALGEDEVDCHRNPTLCENFHFPEGCTPTDRAADHCLDELFALDSDECGNATDVRDVDIPECGSCPGRP